MRVVVRNPAEPRAVVGELNLPLQISHPESEDVSIADRFSRQTMERGRIDPTQTTSDEDDPDGDDPSAVHRGAVRRSAARRQPATPDLTRD